MSVTIDFRWDTKLVSHVQIHCPLYNLRMEWPLSQPASHCYPVDISGQNSMFNCPTKEQKQSPWNRCNIYHLAPTVFNSLILFFLTAATIRQDSHEVVLQAEISLTRTILWKPQSQFATMLLLPVGICIHNCCHLQSKYLKSRPIGILKPDSWSNSFASSHRNGSR